MREENARALIAAVLVVALTAGGPIEAAYLQAGYDAARTGNSPDDGPDRPEVAWRVKLPGSRAEGAAPLIVDGSVYVATFNGTDNRHVFPGEGTIGAGLDVNGLFRIPFDTGVPELVIQLDSSPYGLASDGNRFYVVTYKTGVQAYDATTWKQAWNWSYPSGANSGDESDNRCHHVAVHAETVFVSCSQDANYDAQGAGLSGFADRYFLFAAALDAKSGKPKWISYNGIGTGFNPGGQVPSEASYALVCDRVTGLSVVPPRVFVATRENEAQGGLYLEVAHLRALNMENGAELWSRNESSSGVPTRDDSNPITSGGSCFDPQVFRMPSPTGTQTVVYAKFDSAVRGINAARGEDVWVRPIGKEDARPQEFGSGLAWDGQWLYVASAQTMYRLNATTQELSWSRTLGADTPERFGQFGLILAGEKLYAASSTDSRSRMTVRAYEATTGADFLEHRVEDAISTPINESHFMFSVGERVLTIAGFDGTVTLLGRTAASITPVISTPTTYPETGARVNVSLEDTKPGSQGSATDYRVDWGDGNATEWQESPRFSHAYDQAGHRSATFWARNIAGQTSAEEVVFHVGQQDPALVTREEVVAPVTETALQPENQNTTFFLVGLAIAAGGGLLGALALRKRRGLLKSELRALQDAFEANKTEPLRFESALGLRRRHVQGLLEAGKLNESQFEVLMRRADDLTREARLSGLDDRFAFLPHGLVRMLQRMLEDRRVSPMERESFFAALDREKTLTPEQRERARRLVEEWFSRDSGAR